MYDDGPAAAASSQADQPVAKRSSQKTQPRYRTVPAEAAPRQAEADDECLFVPLFDAHLLTGTSPLEVRVSAEGVRPRRDSAACIVRPDAAAPLCVSPRLDYPAGRKSLIWCLLLLVQCGRHGRRCAVCGGRAGNPAYGASGRTARMTSKARMSRWTRRCESQRQHLCALVFF